MCLSVLLYSPTAPNFHMEHIFAGNPLKKVRDIFIVYILAARSIHHAMNALGTEQQSKYEDKNFSILGLSLDPYAKIREKPCKIFVRMIQKIN